MKVKKICLLVSLVSLSQLSEAAIRSFDGQVSEGIRRTGKISTEQEKLPSYSESLAETWSGENQNESLANRMARLYKAGRKYDKEELLPPAPAKQDDTYGTSFVFLAQRFNRDDFDKIRELHEKEGLALEVYIKESDAKLITYDLKKVVDAHVEKVKALGRRATMDDVQRGMFTLSMRPDFYDGVAKRLKIEQYPSILYVAPSGERRQYPLDDDGFRRLKSKMARVEKAVASGAMKTWTQQFLERIGQYQ